MVLAKIGVVFDLSIKSVLLILSPFVTRYCEVFKSSIEFPNIKDGIIDKISTGIETFTECLYFCISVVICIWINLTRTLSPLNSPPKVPIPKVLPIEIERRLLGEYISSVMNHH